MAMAGRTVRVAAWVGATAFVLAGCGSNPGGNAATGSPSATSPPASTSASPAPTAGSSTSAETSAPRSVTATETEFAIRLSKNSLSPGTYTFMVENQGSVSHNLVIEGPGLTATSSPTLEGGQSGEVTVTLQKGSYELWCSVDGHRALGMSLTISVT